MEVVIKAMDILNQFGWHHFISDCISHFFIRSHDLFLVIVAMIHSTIFTFNIINIKNERKVNDFMQKKLMFFAFATC